MYGHMNVKGTAFVVLGLAWAVEFFACQEFLCFHEMKDCRYIQKNFIGITQSLFSPILIITWSKYGEGRKCVASFGGETIETRPLGRFKHRWVDDIKIGL